MCIVYILYIKNSYLYKKSIDPDIKVGYEINKAVPSKRIVARSASVSGKEQKQKRGPIMSDTQSFCLLIAWIVACPIIKDLICNKKITFTKEEKTHLSVGEKT